MDEPAVTIATLDCISLSITSISIVQAIINSNESICDEESKKDSTSGAMTTDRDLNTEPVEEETKRPKSG